MMTLNWVVLRKGGNVSERLRSSAIPGLELRGPYDAAHGRG